MCTWKKTKTETHINSLWRTTIWSWLIQIQDSEANEILFRMSPYGCLNTMLKSNSYTLKVSAPANRNVCVRKSRQNRVCIGVDTSFCEGDRGLRECPLRELPLQFACGWVNPRRFSKGQGEGYSRELLLGVCRPVLQILTLFRTKKCHFSHPFSDLASRKLFHHYLD